MPIKTYIRKERCEAVQFQYNHEGIKELRQFCEGLVVNVAKGRHPTAVGYAEIFPEDNRKLTLCETDYLMQNSHGFLFVVSKEQFEKIYESV